MAPDCEVEGSIDAPVEMGGVRGSLTPDAPLARLVWFKSGGHALGVCHVHLAAICLYIKFFIHNHYGLVIKKR